MRTPKSLLIAGLLVASTLTACGRPAPPLETQVSEVVQSAAATTHVADLDFQTLGLGPNAFPEERGERNEFPYWYSKKGIPDVVPLESDDPMKQVDERGVLMIPWEGEDAPVFHPVSGAFYGLYSWVAYDHTGEEEYLRRAIANAQELVDTGEVVDGSLWFPYPFDYAFAGDKKLLYESPWYSGMAQGLGLDLFSRLCETTQDDYWCTQADRTFKTFLQTDLPGQTFSRVDENGYLWFEEYVGGDVMPTEVINGHQYAALGLAEYARQTGNEDAKALLDGGSTTLIAYFDNYRLPDEASYYCNVEYCKEIDLRPSRYHRGVTRIFRQMHYLTDMPQFDDIASTLQTDYDNRSSDQ